MNAQHILWTLPAIALAQARQAGLWALVTEGSERENTLILPNRVNVYDKYGNMRGYWVRDIFNPDTWFFKKGR